MAHMPQIGEVSEVGPSVKKEKVKKTSKVNVVGYNAGASFGAKCKLDVLLAYIMDLTLYWTVNLRPHTSCYYVLM